MIDRIDYLKQLAATVRRSPVTALVGPRQCGKTTLAREFASSRHAVHHVKLALELLELSDVERQRRYRQLRGWLHRGQVRRLIDELAVGPSIVGGLRVLDARVVSGTARAGGSSGV